MQYPLDRCAEWRGDAAKLSELLARPDSRLLLFSRDKAMVWRQASRVQGVESVGPGGRDAPDAGDTTEVRWRLAAAAPAAAALRQLEELSAAAAAAEAAAGKAESSDVAEAGGRGISDGDGGAAPRPMPSAPMFMGVDGGGRAVFALDVTSAGGAAAMADVHQVWRCGSAEV
eukprot:357958-Chlamydomonas_euryale.AAC.4